MERTKDNRGFTLMEMVVVLAVIAILAAVLTPIVNSYVERARLNSARSDTKNIAAAIVQFNTDLKFWPIYATTAEVGTQTVLELMSSDGLPAAFGEDVDTEWTAATESGTLSGKLNTNHYAKALSGAPRASIYRGPYLEIGPDPWGTKYYVTSQHLKPGSTMAAYVISAGPNQTIDTAFEQDRASATAFAAGDDDIVTRIR